MLLVDREQVAAFTPPAHSTFWRLWKCMAFWRVAGWALNVWGVVSLGAVVGMTQCHQKKHFRQIQRQMRIALANLPLQSTSLIPPSHRRDNPNTLLISLS